jgi:hypothetical protein
MALSHPIFDHRLIEAGYCKARTNHTHHNPTGQLGRASLRQAGSVIWIPNLRLAYFSLQCQNYTQK